MVHAPTRKVRFKVALGFRNSYRALKATNPEINDTITAFSKCKRQVPPARLPARMKDHALKGKLWGFRECHLAGDILLVYTHRNDIVHLLTICRHDELYGGKGTALKKKIKKLSS
jgi:mRNA interferase YafQ